MEIFEYFDESLHVKTAFHLCQILDETNYIYSEDIVPIHDHALHVDCVTLVTGGSLLSSPFFLFPFLLSVRRATFGICNFEKLEHSRARALKVHVCTSDWRRSIAWPGIKLKAEPLLRFNPLMDRNMMVCYVVCYTDGYTKPDFWLSFMKHAVSGCCLLLLVDKM